MCVCIGIGIYCIAIKVDGIDLNEFMAFNYNQNVNIYTGFINKITHGNGVFQ